MGNKPYDYKGYEHLSDGHGNLFWCYNFSDLERLIFWLLTGFEWLILLYLIFWFGFGELIVNWSKVLGIQRFWDRHNRRPMLCTVIVSGELILERSFQEVQGKKTHRSTAYIIHKTHMAQNLNFSIKAFCRWEQNFLWSEVQSEEYSWIWTEESMYIAWTLLRVITDGKSEPTESEH